MTWLKYFGLGIASLLLLILLAFSPWGVSGLIALVNSSVDNLHIVHRQGGVFGRIELDSIQWQDQGSELTARDVALDINWVCSVPVQLCVDELSIGKLDFKLAHSEPAQPEPDTSEQKITLPWPVSLPNVQLNEVNLQLENVAQIGWQSLSLDMAMFRTLTINRLTLKSPRIRLPAADKPSKPFNIQQITEFEYQPLQLDALNIPLDLNASNLLISDLQVFEQHQALLTLNQIKAKLQIKNSDITISNLAVEHSLASANLSGSIKSDYQLALNGQFATNQDAPETYQARLDLSGDLSALTLNAELKGKYQAELAVNADLQAQQLPIDANLSWQGFTLPAQQPVQISDGELSLSGDLQQYRLRLGSAIQGQTIPKIEMQIAASANRQQLTLSQANFKTLNGSVQVTAQAQLAQQLDWQGELSFNDIAPDTFWPDLQGVISASLSHNGYWSAADDFAVNVEQLSADGSWLGYPLSAEGSASYNSQRGAHVPQLIVASGDNRLQVNGQLDNQQNIDGSLQLTASDLAQLYPGLMGEVRLQSELAGSVQQPQANYQLSAQQIQYADIALQSAESSGSVVWDQQKQVDITTTLKQLIINRQPIDLITLTLNGDAQRHELTTQVSSSVIKFDSVIVGALQASSWQGQWSKGEFSSQYGNYALSNADTKILLDWQDQRYRISPHCWQDGDAQLCINQASYMQQLAQVDLAGKKLELLQVLSQFVPELQKISSDTRLFFSVSGEWQPDQLPQVNANGYLTPTMLTIQGLSKPVDIQQFSFDIDSSNDAATANFELTTAQSGSLNLDLAIEQVSTSQTLDGALTVKRLLLAPYQELVPQLSELSGSIDGKVLISGDLTTPLLGGKVTLANIVLAGDALPGRVDAWTQQVEFDGQKAKLQGEFLFGNGKGQSSGSVDWSAGLLGELSVTGDQFELEYRDTVRAKFSPQVDINMTRQAINVDGKVDVFYARIKVKDLPPNAKSPSDDAVIVNQPATETVSARPLNLNFTVNVDPNRTDDVKLEAFGLKTDLTGSIQLKQSNSKLTGYGDLQLVNGTYKAYGQDLVIRRGDIRFAGPLDNPSLDIEAIRAKDKTQDDVVAGIRVTGPAEQPSVDIFSQPSMVQTQALSYLVTGKDLNKKDGASTPESQMLMGVLLNAGLKGSENKVDQLGRSFGIDDLALGTSSDDSGTQVSLSGYIAPGVQLSYGVNVFDSTSEISLRYQILSNLFIEATSGAKNALDLLYQFSLGGTKVGEQDASQRPSE